MTDARKLLRMSELAEATGVSAQTIHYYLREGLLPPPTKTAPNMAYYGREYVDDIRLIKELQEQRYLPLAVIKLVLDAKRQGKDISQLQDMRLSLDALFRPQGPEELAEPLALVELVAMTGLSAATVEALEQMGILMPAATPQGQRYDGLDLRIARAAKRLLDLGLASSDLALYRQYVEALRSEVRVVREKLFRSPGRGPAGVAGTELKEVLDTLKAALTAKVYRQAVLESHPPEAAGETRAP